MTEKEKINDLKVEKINDPRLLGHTKRSRNGSEQVFYTGNDSRDFDRYGAEGGNQSHGVKMHDKPDTIRIEPPEKHYYAQLIDGEWWWLNGCGECNGNRRDWMTYIECHNHNVCAHCGCDRDSLTEVPRGRENGWVCEPCADIEHEQKKAHALAAMPSDEDFCDWDYHNLHKIKCPHCDYEFSDSWEHLEDDNEEQECPRCDNVFTVTAVHNIEYNCDRKSDK